MSPIFVYRPGRTQKGTPKEISQPAVHRFPQLTGRKATEEGRGGA